MRGRFASGTELILELRRRVLAYIDDSRLCFELTAAELQEIIEVRSGLERKRLEDWYRSNELLAFNIGALCRTAVNAPRQFPKTPEEAFRYDNNHIGR